MKNIKPALIISVISVFVAVMSIASFCINIKSGIICLAMGVTLLIAFYAYTKNRYKKINELNDYLSLICSGNYNLDISDNSEGELSILKNNLYKVMVLLRSSNEALKNDKVFLSDSLADISHQLKTPLTSIMVITDLLKDETNEEKRKEFVGIIESQCEKMKWLITTLLKLSKLDAGTADFIIEKTSVSSLINDSLKPFMLTIDLKQINLVKKIEKFDIRLDKNWSMEAIGNIIKNCIEHTQNGGELTVSASQTTLYNEIKIRDNGAGISEEDLPHIFERFYCGKNAAHDSVGIGLALSKAILKKQNASISVKSSRKEGTEFEIRFYKSII